MSEENKPVEQPKQEPNSIESLPMKWRIGIAIGVLILAILLMFFRI